MPATVTISVLGLNQFIDRIRRAPKAMQDEIDRELRDGADAIIQRAQRKLATPRGGRSQPTNDRGRLSGGITRQDVGPMNYNVTSSAKQSPYIEWGTKKYVSVPAELSAYASRFKGGGGGSWRELLQAIKGWVKRKGIRFDGTASYKSGKKKGQKKKLTYDDTAMLVTIGILKNGIKPQPFFFSSLKEEEPQIVKNVLAVLNRII